MTPQKRDCLFFVADAAIADVVDGFFSRGHLDRRIGCRTFAFDFAEDVLVGSTLGYTDGGMHMHCHRLLQELGYMETHERLIVMLDQQFGGERPAAEVRTEILGRLQSNGWGDDKAEVVVIDPELEVWLWQDSPHVQAAVGYSGHGSLRDSLRNDGEWLDGQSKPLRPKALFKELCRRHRTPYSSALYRYIVERVSVRNCNDNAFQQLIAALSRWFRIGDQA